MTVTLDILEVSVPKGGMLSPRDVTVFPLNWELILLLTVFGLCCGVNASGPEVGLVKAWRVLMNSVAS